MKNIFIRLITLTILLSTVIFQITACKSKPDAETSFYEQVDTSAVFLDDIPEYEGSPFVEINNNQPDFSFTDRERTDTFEIYSELDHLGRCGQTYANISKDTMPTEEREAINQIRPSGWHTAKYSGLVEKDYLYNRCHLIAYSLAGENANEKNLITGTRYMNTVGMLPFENKVAAYVDRTLNHVLYRVTPIFQGDNLIASGVEMEAWSVEDNGSGICFHVYCYNVQPGIWIDYETGESHILTSVENHGGVHGNDIFADQAEDAENAENGQEKEYVLNTNTHKIHLPNCSSVADMKEKNKKQYFGTLEELIKEGYDPCRVCLGDYCISIFYE